MSQRKGKKRAFSEIEDGISISRLHELARPKRKKRRRNRSLSKHLLEKYRKATAAWVSKEYETAKSLAQEVVNSEPRYPDVYDLLGKINEDIGDYSNALTAYSTYVALRYPLKTVQSDTSRNLFKPNSNNNNNDGDNNDSSDDSDFDDDDDYDKNSKHPTPHLIEKIFQFAIKSANYDMALKMIGMIESHYKHLLNKINDPKNKEKISYMTQQEIDNKKQEILNYLLNIYRQRAIIYNTLKQFDAAKHEYELIYNQIHRNTHPLIVSKNKILSQHQQEKDVDDDDDIDIDIDDFDIDDIEIDKNHDELLNILIKICPKSYNHTSYRYLFNYFDLWMKDNKFNENHEKYIKWLIDEIKYNINYKRSFYRLLSVFVKVGMEMCRFRAILKFIQTFDHHLVETMPFSLKIKEGICLLWLNRIDESMKHYNNLIAAPQETGYGSLYMLFADACIAKNKLKMAQVLMNKIEQISTFNVPRIWMRFADCYALQGKYKKAITKYIEVINTAQSQIDHDNNDKNKDVLLSARLKLLEIYFTQNDEENARKLLKIIEEYKEQQIITTDDMDEEKMNEQKMNEQEEYDGNNLMGISSSSSPIESVSSVLGKTIKPQKRIRLNAQLTSYFDTGLFGSVLVPKELLHLELLNIELRSQYLECVELFKNEQYYQYLIKCESKIIELFSICHESPKLLDTIYCVKFEKKENELFGLQLKATDEQHQIGAVVMVNYHSSDNKDNNIMINKLSEIISINNENCREYKFDEIIDILNAATIPTMIEFINPQNIYPLLKQNRNITQKRIYTMNHLAHVLKDKCILELVVLICKIWYQCDTYYDEEEDNNIDLKCKSKQIELILSMITESGSSLNPSKLEMDSFLMAELHVLMANIYFNKKDYESCYHELVRVLDLQPNNVNAMRYLYIMYRHLSHDPKIERTIKRQLSKRENDNKNNNEMVWHQLILGHTSFSKNSYDIAANTYTQIIKKYKNSPFMHLILSITYLQHAMKRTTKKHKYLVTIQGIAFMKQYVKLSKNTTESLYNFARAFHLLGLYGTAQILYDKIIKKIKNNTNNNNNNNSFNPIRRYCAYNLSKIYLRSGQNELAIQTLKQNIIV